ncbi:MAG: hypothetical protein ACK5SX_08580 [Sandaracinobacter sp.]
MLTWLPSYFRDARKLSIANAGLFLIAHWIALFLIGNIVAWFADRQIAAGADIGRVRKITQITGLLGSAAFLLAAGVNISGAIVWAILSSGKPIAGEAAVNNAG